MRRPWVTSSISPTNTFLVKAVAPGLPSAVYLVGVVYRLLRQPENLSSAHPKSSDCGSPYHKKNKIDVGKN